jgi:oligopeptide transport system substrate-binding protein
MIFRSALCSLLLAFLATAALAKSPMVFRIGNGAEPQDLDPQFVTGDVEHRIASALFEGLLSPDPKDLHPMPGQAESWTISTDGLVYTFKLRPGLKWSNGDPLTAEDFVQSYKRMLSPTFAAENAYMIYNYVAGAEEYYKGEIKDFTKVGFKAVDPLTLQITLKNRTPFLLKLIACHHSWFPVPLKVIASHGPVDQKRNGWTKAENIVGNGPFILKEWLPNQKIVVVRNPNYWDATNVKLDAIEFNAIEDDNSAERMFRTGQLDVLKALPTSKIDTYRKKSPELLHIDPFLCVYFYSFNVTKPPFNDKRVRKAFALAVNRESLVKNVTRGGQIPAYAISYPNNAGYTANAKLTGDLAEAKKSLAEAGYPDGKGLPPIELLYNTNDGHRSIGEAIQAMWRTNLGVEITLHNQEWKVYLDSLHSHDFQLLRYGWLADYIDPNVFLEIWTTDNGNNNTLWSNAEYDRLFKEALAAKDEATRYEIYQKMDAIIVDECPMIPIYYYTHVYALNPKVKGYYSTLLDIHPAKYIWVED